MGGWGGGWVRDGGVAQTTSNGLKLNTGVSWQPGVHDKHVESREVDAGDEALAVDRHVGVPTQARATFPPSRDAVRKGVDNIASERGLWFKFSREMRALRGLPPEKEREALRPPTQRRAFPSSPPSAAANPAKEGDASQKTRR